MARVEIRRWAELVTQWLGASFTAFATYPLLLWIHADSAAAGLVYLVLIVLFASFAGKAVSVYLAVLSALIFDYFFVSPYGTLNIAGYQSWLSMVAFVLSCVVVSRTADRARRQTRQAQQRREDVERLYELTQDLMLHGESAHLGGEIPRILERRFALDRVVIYLHSDDSIYATAPDLPAGILEILRHAPMSAEPEKNLVEGYTATHVLFGMKSIGVLAWKPDTLTREVAVSMAAQVAVVVTSANAIEASARLEAARSTDRLRTAMIDSLTHELRTPLTAIRAAATTLVDGSGLDDASRRELATIVDEESSRLDELIGEAMEIAMIESHSVRTRPEPQHTATFLEQALQQSHAELATRKVTIEVQEPDDPVWFDPHLIGRALRHLLENAGRYTPESSHILLESRRSQTRLEFVVTDDGPGIDPHDLPLIFEKFYRGSRHENRTRGTGMGLAIARALVAVHGGEITVASTPGRGASFCISIPRIDRSPEAFAPHDGLTAKAATP